VLAEHGLRPQRRLGQHFLVDANTARRIVRLAGIAGGEQVLEIGPGVGSLTLALVDASAQVLALEIDARLAEALRAVLRDEDVLDEEQDRDWSAGRARVVVGDAMEARFDALLGGSHPWSCVSNLPYNVAVPVVMRVLDEVHVVERMLVMVQREVGERLAARVGDPQYGAVSVRVAYRAQAAVVGVVPATVFVPVPKVESVLVRLRRWDAPPVTVPSVAALFALVRAGFAQRRKMLRGALRPVLGARVGEVLEHAGIDPGTRAESLSLEDWAALSRAAAT
jgi:16S rRNA (adenine1518-N6/adenine1519-N6)-dimethyltransferase